MTEDQGRLDYYVTQLEVLRSRGLARKTLEQLDLLSTDPTRQSGQISQMLAGLTVSPVRSDMGESRVINLTVEIGRSRACGAASERARADLCRSKPGRSPPGEPRCLRVAERSG